MLGRFGLLLPLCINRNERHMHEREIAGCLFPLHLPCCFEKRHGLDVTNRAADLDQADICPACPCHRPDLLLDLVCNMRDDLHRASKIIAPPLLFDHCPVYLPCGDVVVASEFGIKEPLVVAEIEIDLAAILQHKDLAVLERAHGSGIDIDIRIDLDRGHLVSLALQDSSDG